MSDTKYVFLARYTPTEWDVSVKTVEQIAEWMRGMEQAQEEVPFRVYLPVESGDLFPVRIESTSSGYDEDDIATVEIRLWVYVLGFGDLMMGTGYYTIDGRS